MSDQTVTGGCYCGKIRYELTSEIELIVNCHCNNCRKAAGAQSVVWMLADHSGFSWTKGIPVRYLTDTQAHRTFCPDCGTSLTYESPKRTNQIDITVGSLDHPEKFAPERDAYLKYRLPWVSKIEY